MSEVNNKKILKESNINLYKERETELTRILSKIYEEQKSLFTNVYLPNIIKKGLVKNNKKEIYDFINQQLTISILNELYEVEYDTIEYYDSIMIKDRYEFLYELIDIVHFVMQGIYVTSEYLEKIIDFNNIIKELLDNINTQEVQLKEINYQEDYKYTMRKLYSLTAQLPNFYDWKHWKKHDIEIETNKVFHLHHIYMDILYHVVFLFLELEDMHLLEKMYDIKNKVNRERQKNGY